MNSPSAKVWLRSSLLERLTDHHPERRREAPEEQRVDHAILRSLLLRDISWLFNSTHLSATRDLSDFPEVERSVLNYGIPALTGRTLSGLNEAQLRQHILDALTRYESRLVRGTIDVRVHASARAAGRPSLLIEIAAELRAEPLPIALRVLAEVDLESGRVAVSERRSHEEG